jgi:hypothetical protein
MVLVAGPSTQVSAVVMVQRPPALSTALLSTQTSVSCCTMAGWTNDKGKLDFTSPSNPLNWKV